MTVPSAVFVGHQIDTLGSEYDESLIYRRPYGITTLTVLKVHWTRLSPHLPLGVRVRNRPTTVTTKDFRQLRYLVTKSSFHVTRGALYTVTDPCKTNTVNSPLNDDRRPPISRP